MKNMIIVLMLLSMLSCASFQRTCTKEKAKFKENPVKYTTLFIVGTTFTIGTTMLMLPPIDLPK